MILYTFDEKETQEIVNYRKAGKTWEEIGVLTMTNTESAIMGFLKAKENIDIMIDMLDNQHKNWDDLLAYFDVPNKAYLMNAYISDDRTHNGDKRICPICGAEYNWKGKTFPVKYTCSQKCNKTMLRRRDGYVNKSTRNEFKETKKAEADVIAEVYGIENDPRYYWDEELEMFLMKEEYMMVNLKKFRHLSLEAGKSYGQYISDRECEEANKLNISHQELNEYNHKTWCDSLHTKWEVSAL